LEWNDAMSVGIPEIDEDHKFFITLVNRFNESVADRMDIAEVRQRMQDIVNHTERHFADEEKLLNEFGYPDAADHARIHAQVKDELRQVMGSIPTGGTDYELIEAGLKIKQKIIDHILEEDMKYAEYHRESCAADPEGK
jgi:hemerythrin